MIDIIGKLISGCCVLFLAVDIIGHLIAFLSVSADLQPKQVRKNLVKSVYFLCLFSLGFMLLCWIFLKAAAISDVDLQVAAGVLLLIFSVYTLLNKAEEISFVKDSKSIPAAAQLIISPVFLIALLALMSISGFIITVLALGVNLIIAVYFLINSSKIVGLLEVSGVKIFSKAANMLLCAYAIMLIRQAILSFVN